jgi:outer membrane protein assembly factor BamD
MYLRISLAALVLTVALFTACTNKKVSNPLAKVDSKQPDKTLFDRGMDAMKHNRFDVARLDMQTLINAYPDSEYIARAKLALADSWYAESGSAAWAQAEQEYKDFITFFPNMPEAAEAQLRIADIHFQQMEKPDRDFTHAMRAENEYRQCILQYPDNQKMAAQARTKLLQVQEVIAEREFRIGRFYYLRESFPAAIARLQSMVDRYPLYSKADEALYLLGQSYEGEVAALKHMDATERQQMERLHKMNEEQLKRDERARERLATNFIAKASEAYSRILTRYPVMNRADDAKARLMALQQPVPRPTKAALAQNKAEEDARRGSSTLGSMMGVFSRHPDVSSATRVGSPSLQDQEPISASTLVQEANRVAAGSKPTGNESVSVATTGNNPLGANEPAPRSDTPPQAAADANPATSEASQPDPNEMKPPANTSAADASAAAAPDPNELKPNVPADAQPAAAPKQVNELATSGQEPAGGTAGNATSQEPADDASIASSKHKKKKGLKKIVPIK